MKRLLTIAGTSLALLGLGYLSADAIAHRGPGHLTWSAPVVKKSLMTFAYKVYANPAAENGRYFLSKIVFQNTGKGMVRDFSVSYQIPDYLPWTTPETHTEIPSGQTLVKLFYPQLPAKVTQLTNLSTATLETRIRWSDEDGRQKEEILRSNVDLRGVNEVEYTDLPSNEILTWYDMFATSPFTAAMVTPNDPVVKEFVAEITRRTGGTTAGISGGVQEIARLMEETYNYMIESGMRYTSDQGVPSNIGDVRTVVQTVRMPRDVIMTNQGLCVELAILWASAMEHLGLRTTLLFRPGHAFTLVWYGQGPNDFIPVECTAISPMAVGAQEHVPFEQAVKMAQEDLQKQQFQIWVNVQEYQNRGYRAPELPAVEIDKIKAVLTARRNGQEMLVRRGVSGQKTPQPEQSDMVAADTAAADTVEETGTADDTDYAADDVPAGCIRWSDNNSLISVDVPANWPRMENCPVPGMIFATQDMNTSVNVNVFHFPGLRDVGSAMKTARQNASARGLSIQVAGSKSAPNGTLYWGTTASDMGMTEWTGIFRKTKKGVVGFFVGANAGFFQQNQPLINQLSNSVRFAD